ncbi:MAG: hypothetical protein KJ601_06145 [Nanoarchaeota archaeon]|nr:hypothetical protein [Nanoarchaeota archaeon]
MQNDALFFHKPHGSPDEGMTPEIIKRFEHLCKDFFDKKPEKLTIKDVTFITYNNSGKKSLIERCYDHWGITNYFVLAKDYKPWDWMGKVKPFLDFLTEGKCKTELIVATDANDVLIKNNPNRIIESFKSYQCQLLFCNTNSNWPPNKELNEFEKSKYPGSRYHNHLSAGALMGTSDFIQEMLESIIKMHKSGYSMFIHKGKFDDQLAWRHLHKQYYPKIKIDSRCKIFARFDEFLEIS